jgi:hypothetical protein
MNKNICKTIVQNKTAFTKHIFTKRQLTIMEKYINKTALTPTEQTYLYSTIKKKIDALSLLKEEYHITGTNMIPERITQAKTILKSLNKPAFISGSFLYKQDYKDIDIFIITIKRKHMQKGNHHLTYITEHDLSKPLFLSAAKYSVSTFSINIKPDIKREPLSEILLAYQLSINEVLDNTDQKTLRQLIFYHAIYVKKEIPDSYTLYKRWKELLKQPKKEKLKQVTQLSKELLKALYSPIYLYRAASQFQNSIKNLMKDYHTNNLPLYINFAQEVKNECRRAEA